MAKTYKLMVAHRIAQIEPSLTTGTATAGYPKGNARTLNPNHHSRATEAGSDPYYARYDFGRPASGLNAISGALLWVGNGTALGTVEIISGTDTAIPQANASSLVNESSVGYGLHFYKFSADTQRYVRLQLTDTGSAVEASIGLCSVGAIYDLGMEQMPAAQSGKPGAPGVVTGHGEPTVGGLGGGARSIEKEFRKVLNTDVDNIMDEWSSYQLLTTDSSENDGIGSGAGRNPCVLAYYSDDTNTEADTVWYGQADVRVVGRTATYSTLRVSMTPIRITGLAI